MGVGKGQLAGVLCPVSYHLDLSWHEIGCFSQVRHVFIVVLRYWIRNQSLISLTWLDLFPFLSGLSLKLYFL